MTAEELAALTAALAESAAFRSKCDIADVGASVPAAPHAVDRWRESAARVRLGDDTAAIPDAGGYLLFAAEGILPEFLEGDPYFAGYCAVMVNVSDVAAMGGWPLAVVDVYFHAPSSASDQVLSGMRAACEAYGVPLVGGHTTRRPHGPHVLAVAILGRAKHLLTSFAAKVGDVLLAAVDLRGEFHADFPFWNATRGRRAEGLRGDLRVLTELAAGGFVNACKDVSNAGVAGTVLMLIEASSVGATLNLDALPRPAAVDLFSWLLAFPSYGFVLSVPSTHADQVRSRFHARGIACAEVGSVDSGHALRVRSGEHESVLWDLARRPFTGFCREAFT